MSKQDAQSDFHILQVVACFCPNPTRIAKQRSSTPSRRSEDLHRPWVFLPNNHEEYASYLERIRERTHDRLPGPVQVRQGLAGVINVSEPVMGVFRSAYLGFYAFSGFAAKGYMTEALSLLLDYAFEELGFHRLEANVQPANFASSSACRAVGFPQRRLFPALSVDRRRMARP